MKLKLVVAALLVYIFPALLMLRSYKEEPVLQVHPSEPSQEQSLTVSVLQEGAVEKMDLEEYIFQVVLAEMPADFETEALKAQAVVARTYTCRRLLSPKHTDGQVCTDASCCQAFISEQDYLRNGGTEQSVEKVKRAVLDTAGQVLLYEDKLIEATYFSCSGGKTEDAQAVWGTAVPYLQSVESPGEEHAVHYTDTVIFTDEEFCEKLGIWPGGHPGSWIGSISYTNGGGVDTVEIGGTNFTGTQFRKLLGLRSTAFVITAAGERITVTTKGFGHRVGMSQYGADAMAVQGADHETILLYYYQGAVLSGDYLSELVDNNLELGYNDVNKK